MTTPQSKEVQAYPGTSGKIFASVIPLLIYKVNLVLNTITLLALEEDTLITDFLVNREGLKIYLITLNEIWDENAVFDTTNLSIINNAINTTTFFPDSVIDIKSQSIEVQLLNIDKTINIYIS